LFAGENNITEHNVTGIAGVNLNNFIEHNVTGDYLSEIYIHICFKHLILLFWIWRCKEVATCRNIKNIVPVIDRDVFDNCVHMYNFLWCNQKPWQAIDTFIAGFSPFMKNYVFKLSLPEIKCFKIKVIKTHVSYKTFIILCSFCPCTT